MPTKKKPAAPEPVEDRTHDDPEVAWVSPIMQAAMDGYTVDMVTDE